MDSLGEKDTRKTRPKSDSMKSIALEHGKLPPQAVDLEEGLLGGMMLGVDVELRDVIYSFMESEVFYKESHQRIFEAIQYLHNKNESADILTVTAQLKKTGELEIVGGPYYISQLTNRVASSANAEYHARIIYQKYIQRELIRLGSNIIRDAYEDTTDVFSLLEFAGMTINDMELKIRAGKEGKKLDSFIEKALQSYDERERIHNEGILTAGVKTPLKKLDELINGWQKTDLIIIASRPGMGKTFVALAIAKSAAKAGSPVAVFELEMTGTRLADRMIIGESGVWANSYLKGSLNESDKARMHEAAAKLKELGITINDDFKQNIKGIKAAARKLVSKEECEILIIDYLQLVETGDHWSREQEVAAISREAKGIAKDLDIPVILLCQLSRAVEQRGGDKRPQLSDLRESGAIEQDADMVIFPYRPDYYGYADKETGLSLAGWGELIIAKNRNGAPADIPFKHNVSLTEMYDDDNDIFKDEAFAKVDQLTQQKHAEGYGKTIKAGRNLDSIDDEAPF